MFFKANKDNPLGLYRIGETTYQLVAYFIFNNMAEIYAPSRKHMSINKSEMQFYYSFPSWTFWEKHKEKANQLKHYFKKEYSKHIMEHADFGYCFLFKQYEEPISFKMQKNITIDYRQAVIDYFGNRETLPMLITDNCFYNVYKSKVINKKDISKHFSAMTLKKAEQILLKHELNKDNKNYKKEKIVEVAEYPEFIQEDRQTFALLKGGFVEFTFADTCYFLPKLPLLALSDPSFEGHSYTRGLFTWFFDCSVEGISNNVLSDIFMIGNIKKELVNHKIFMSDLLLLSKKLLKEEKGI